MNDSNPLAVLYSKYDGHWGRFFSDAADYWKQQSEKKPEFEQPELLGCPWCGVIPVVRRMLGVSPETFDVYCRNHDCPRRKVIGRTPQEAADQWNKRAHAS